MEYYVGCDLHRRHSVFVVICPTEHVFNDHRPGRINLQDTQNAFGYSIANPSARWKHHVVLSHAVPVPSAQSRDREGRSHENCESRAAGRHFNGAFPSHARQQVAYRPSTQTRKEAQPPTVLNQENAHTLRRMAGDYQKL